MQTPSPSNAPVSVMIFTLNEEQNLPACLDSLGWCADVIVIDSFSTDRTQQISEQAGARFFQNRFEGFGDQRNWALANTHPKFPWVLILDADERVPPELASELTQIATADPAGIGAYRVRRRFYMWGRWLRYSSLYPTWVVRFIRMGRVAYQNRGHAETQAVQGQIADLQHDLIDENLKGIDEWFDRQNRYATQDARFEVLAETTASFRDLWAPDPLARRAALKRVAARVPARGFVYFLYSYLVRGGFRDGADGFVFCRMRAMYQSQVAVKAYDLRRTRQAKRSTK
jgi:glycosyltransferase involved in cell wall biosynthesis